MKKRIQIGFILLSLLFAAIHLHAQNGASPRLWKKRVERNIDLAQKEDTVIHRLRDAQTDSPLVEMLVDALNYGNITAYWPNDMVFSKPILFREFRLPVEITNPDTSVVIDPVTGEEFKKLLERIPDWGTMHKLHVMEDWTYDTNGNTKIEIVAIGPVLDSYNENGKLHAEHILFWTRYKDAKTIIDRYEQYHPDNTISQHIWHDYFLSDKKPTPVK